MTRVNWVLVLDEARAIVESYDTWVTLRQLFYRLVARQLIPNTPSYYRRLSQYTAQARRELTFPELIDRTRDINEPLTFVSPDDAHQYLYRTYRRDRTEGQDVALYLGSEKDGIVTQLDSWFGDLGLPLLALGGYSSQTYCDDIVSHVGRGRRPAILLYAGDHDPSGWDIPRDFIDKTNCWDDVHRIALTPEQVEEYQLPESIGKEADPRTPAFIERFGSLVQVEMDALEPDVLRGLYQDAIDRYWHTEAYEAALTREEADRAELARRWQL